MLLGLDHLVVAVADPDAAADALEQTVGLACTGGGRHPAWGTFNHVLKKGSDGSMELRRVDIPEMRQDLKDIIKEQG